MCNEIKASLGGTNAHDTSIHHGVSGSFTQELNVDGILNTTNICLTFIEDKIGFGASNKGVAVNVGNLAVVRQVKNVELGKNILPPASFNVERGFDSIYSGDLGPKALEICHQFITYGWKNKSNVFFIIGVLLDGTDLSGEHFRMIEAIIC